jgi:hypothetical protein
VLVAGSGPHGREVSGDETLARLSLGLLGVLMCVAPPIAVAMLGWLAAPLAPMIPTGALFVVLAAFYERIAGEVRFGLCRLSIQPAGSRKRGEPGASSAREEVKALASTGEAGSSVARARTPNPSGNG